MTSTFLRRARGVAVTMLTWGVAWGAVGALVGGALLVGFPWPTGHRPGLDLVWGCAIAGALAGATSAVAYAGSLIAAARRRRFDELRLRTTAGLGAGAAFVTGFLISRDLAFATACGTLGLGASAGSLALARRATLPAGERPLELEA